jgi:hypothetical protein
VHGTQELFKLLAELPGVTGTVIQTVGSKGWDGFLIAVVG